MINNLGLTLFMRQSKVKIAHVRQLPDGTWDKPHLLDQHLLETARRSANFAQIFGSEKWGYAAGLSHDTGKNPERWQEYLIRKSGFYDEEAHLEGKPGKIEHSASGAKLVEEVYGKNIGQLLAYCISGHHAGLPDWFSIGSSGKSALCYRLKNDSMTELTTEFKYIEVNSGSFPFLSKKFFSW